MVVFNIASYVSSICVDMEHINTKWKQCFITSLFHFASQVITQNEIKKNQNEKKILHYFKSCCNTADILRWHLRAVALFGVNLLFTSLIKKTWGQRFSRDKRLTLVVLPHAYLQTMNKTSLKVQKTKTVEEVNKVPPHSVYGRRDGRTTAFNSLLRHTSEDKNKSQVWRTLTNSLHVRNYQQSLHTREKVAPVLYRCDDYLPIHHMSEKSEHKFIVNFTFGKYVVHVLVPCWYRFFLWVWNLRNENFTVQQAITSVFSCITSDKHICIWRDRWGISNYTVN